MSPLIDSEIAPTLSFQKRERRVGHPAKAAAKAAEIAMHLAVRRANAIQAFWNAGLAALTKGDFRIDIAHDHPEGFTFSVLPVNIGAFQAILNSFSSSSLAAFAHVSATGTGSVDYRSDNNEFGSGSLQVVFNSDKGVGYFDVDRFNPRQDVASFIGHAIESWSHKIEGHN